VSECHWCTKRRKSKTCHQRITRQKLPLAKKELFGKAPKKKGKFGRQEILSCKLLTGQAVTVTSLWKIESELCSTTFRHHQQAKGANGERIHVCGASDATEHSKRPATTRNTSDYSASEESKLKLEAAIKLWH